MSPYKQKGRVVWHVKVPTRSGWINRSTGTEDRATARATRDAYLQRLGTRRLVDARNGAPVASAVLFE